MLKNLTIVLGLGLVAVAGCKTDAPDSSASEKKSETTTASGPKPRSGKIELPNAPAPRLPADEAKDDRGPSEARDERRRQRMAEFDTDGDGQLSDAEREAARAKREADLKARLDANKDGIVSDEERGAARHQRVVDMHARFDTDGDGKLTPAELEAAPFGRIDATADTNNDGQVSVDELEAAMRERGGMRRGGFRRGRGGGSDAPSE